MSKNDFKYQVTKYQVPFIGSFGFCNHAGESALHGLGAYPKSFPKRKDFSLPPVPLGRGRG